MIKVNLLREYGAKAKKVRMPTMPASMVGIYLLVGFTVIALGVFGAWYYLDGDITRMTEERDRLTLEGQRLKKLRADIEVAKKRKTEVEHRIEVIQNLKENQTGPVLILNTIIQAIPTNPPVWLTIVEQRAERVRLTGFAQRQEIISDFMTALARSGFFKDVELNDLVEMPEAAEFKMTLTSAKRPVTD